MNTLTLINQAFTNIQKLQIEPTEHNINLLAETLKALREAYGEANKTEQALRELKAKADAEEETGIEDEDIIIEAEQEG